MGVVVPLPKPRRMAPIVQSEVFAMLIFVFAEIMLFAGFLSAFELVGARAPAGWWPPPGDPALPVAATGGATVALLLSGVAVGVSGLRAAAGGAVRWLGLGVVLGAVFVGYQAYEFSRLVQLGFTLQSSAHGGFFYTIVGAHGLHALAGMAVLVWAARAAAAERLTPGMAGAVRILWTFVVVLWPAIYAVVYL